MSAGPRDLVYLNGAFLPAGEARIAPDDRGFLFADGVYEAVLARRGAPLLWDQHMQRLAAGLEALAIAPVDLPVLHAVGRRLLRDNDLAGGDATIYLQVTRGAAPRSHAFPVPSVPPTVYVAARRLAAVEPELWARGVAVITVADTRWARCDIKSIALLPNVLAQQRAVSAGVWEAVFVRDGVPLEGSHSNLFLVAADGVLWTYPECNYVLPGVTRRQVLRLAAELELPLREGVLPRGLESAREVFLTGTTTFVMPVVRVDGRLVGDGAPGPVTRRLAAAYAALLDGLIG
ncbi:MAG TPA: aminotransferase class IV [Thermoanaerobaculia bacterium]|nr:aminotransferase class IV [Thermoanaerobaculia bacterium]